MSTTYIGPMWTSKFLPIVGQGCANSITTTPCCRDRTDRWTLNRQHFPLMLLVPRLKSMKQNVIRNTKDEKKTTKSELIQMNKKNYLFNSIVETKRCSNSHCVKYVLVCNSYVGAAWCDCRLALLDFNGRGASKFFNERLTCDIFSDSLSLEFSK